MSEVLPRLGEFLFPRHLPDLIKAIAARPRLVMGLEIALVLYLTMFLTCPPASAAGLNPLDALDRKDEAGYMVSNYNIEYLIDVLNTKVAGQNMTAWWVGVIWEIYRWGVSFAALLIDLTIGFGWLEYLSYPVEQTAEVLDKLLDQLPGVRELLIVLAVGVGVTRMWFGQQARGLTDMFGSFAAWGLSAAIVTNPVAWLTGPNGILTRTTEGAQQFSAQLVDPDAAAGAADPSEAAGSLAKSIVTIFVRKPHQFLAYGGLADGGGCEQTYNDNLHKSGKDLANAMLKCSPDFGETIKNPSATTLVTALIITLGAIVLIGIAVICSGIIIYEVLDLLIQGVLAVWELFRAVGPGGSYRGLLGIVINVMGCVLALLAVVMMSAFYLAAVQYFFEKWEQNMIVLFLIVDVILVVVVALIFRMRKRMHKAFERMKERTRAQKAPQPKMLSRSGRGGGISTGIGAAAGSRLAHGAGRVGSRLAHTTGRVGRGAGRLATAPVRAATRHVSRPGFMAARLGSGMLHRSGIHDKRSHRLVRGVAYNRGEKKWRKKEAARVEKREKRAERRQRGKHWTWSAATRDADQRASVGPSQSTAPAPKKGRRPQRRSEQTPGPTPQKRTARRKGSTPAPRNRDDQSPSSTRPGKKGPAPASRRNTSTTPAKSNGRSPSANPRREGGASPSAGERLHSKMHAARRGSSSSPRPQAGSRTVRKKARSAARTAA